MRNSACLFAAIALALGWAFTPIQAQEHTPDASESAEFSSLEDRAEQVIDLINAKIEPEEVFSDGFLAAISPEQIKGFAKGLVTQYGAALEVERLEPRIGTRAAYEVRFERGIAKGGIAIDPAADYAVSELLFTTVEPIIADGDSIEKVKADLAALPGTVSAYFGPMNGDTPALSLNADTPLGLGSTFKLYVLAALGKEVADGARNWDDIVSLSVKSYPSGMMQDFPQGSPATLYTYASLMMSISDNTATDQLINLLGRERVYKIMLVTDHSNPELSAPLLTTRELFLLKGGVKARLETYAEGTLEERLAILETIETAPPSQAEILAAFSGNPVRIDVEWLSSANDLIRLFKYMRQTADPQTFDIMGINKGIGEEYLTGWTYVGHKGGSEPGVRNLTWLLTDENSIDHVLTLGWNNPDADISTQQLLGFAQRILILAQQMAPAPR
ncbi:serine hydrolase [Erythrobacter sp. YT30]|uniref:serine hydrolase n=1 Tax=Erythrobacter sp. YT30 TaxID=1735012 RepID=UPI00076D6EC5|nr:serine hydrolase [Erythrobacter sp. YT30]KWV92952.1 hypothetical protein AUC45_02065 [Erythrobacter sp. YT30]